MLARRRPWRPCRRSTATARSLPRTALSVLVALAAGLHPLPSRAGRLEVFSEQLPCPNRSAIDARIAERVADLMVAQPDLALFLRPTAPSVLELRLVGADDESRREIAFHRRDCRDLAETVALIVRAWVVRRWSFPIASASASRVPEAARKPVQVDTPLSPGVSTPASPAALQAAIRVGGFQAARAGQSGWTAAGELAWRFSQWGAAVLAGHDAAVRGSARDHGYVDAAPWDVGLAARWHPSSNLGGQFDLSAGLGVSLLTAHSVGVRVQRSATTTIPSVFLGARWVQPLASRVSATAGVDVTVQTMEEVYSIDGVGRVLYVSPVRARFTLGGVFDLIE